MLRCFGALLLAVVLVVVAVQLTVRQTSGHGAALPRLDEPSARPSFAPVMGPRP